MNEELRQFIGGIAMCLLLPATVLAYYLITGQVP